MDDIQKYKVISLLQQDQQPKDIAADLDISYGSVLKLRREYEEAKVNGTVDKLLNADKVVLVEVEEKLNNLAETQAAVIELAKGIDGLEQLSEEFQKTANIINTHVKSLILRIDHMSELEIATDILCKLQTAFVNKNMTQVNVQNNFGGDNTPKYTQFLSDKPGD